MVRKIKPKKGITPSFQLISETPNITGAPCQSGVDPETFFPDPTDTIRIKIAKDLCGTCPQTTKSKCLTFAIDNKINYGIWGGLTDNERRNMRRRLHRS